MNIDGFVFTPDRRGNINCINCEDCDNCINCENCKDCNNCVNCVNCEDCSVDCKNCVNCKDCDCYYFNDKSMAYNTGQRELDGIGDYQLIAVSMEEGEFV